MRRLVRAILPILMFSAAAPAADDYKLGPDSQPQDGVPKGTVTKHTWKEQGLPRHRARLLGLRPGPVQPDGPPACVMVFQDGGSYQNPKGQFRVPVVFDNLIHKKEMPVTVGIFINPGDVPHRRQGKGKSNRSFEYDTLSDQYVRFLEKRSCPRSARP